MPIQTLRSYPADNACNYQGNLVGKFIAVDPRHGSDFEDWYNPHGLASPKATEHFRVTADNQDSPRQISFEDHRGTVYHGNATRFTVLSP